MKPTIQKALTADSLKSMQLLVNKQNQIEQHWRVLGSGYDYSVKNLIAELSADKKWYNIPDSKKPMSAMQAYTLEKKKGIVDIAHTVNEAAKWFAKFRRENKTNSYKAIKR